MLALGWVRLAASHPEAGVPGSKAVVTRAWARARSTAVAATQ